MNRMEGKVVLITGAGRGQGRSHAVALAREGASILALDCPGTGTSPYPLASSEDLNTTVELVEQEDARIIAVEGDVRNQDSLDQLVAQGLAEFGHIDVVIANAALWTVGNFWELPEQDWKDVMDVNVLGVWRTVKAVTPHMMERQQGSIILISSINGLEGGHCYAHYVASKHAVLGLMKSVALELGPHGIRCNAICPGVIDTAIVNWQGPYDIMAGGGPGSGSRAHLEQAGRAYTLLKDRGLLSPDPISKAALYLASDDSSEVTGLEMVIDGGHRVLPGLNPAALYAATPG